MRGSQPAVLLVAVASATAAQALPPNFSAGEVAGDWNQAVGLTFDATVCTTSDFNGDGIIDLLDLPSLQAALTGPASQHP